MPSLSNEVEEILNSRFGKDTVIALATAENDMPHVRGVNAIYDNGAFYIITYAVSNKIKQIEKNPNVAICGEWFTAHGTAINLGYIGSDENRLLAEKLRAAFSEWIDNGHVDFCDQNTVILCVKLKDGVLFSNSKRYDIDFPE